MGNNNGESCNLRETNADKHEYASGGKVFTKEEWGKYPFASDENLQWFRDAKMGLFFHVGIAALGKVDIGWSRHTHKLPDPGVGIIPDEIYDGWSKQIKLDNFNADEWAQLAIDGGMKYVVIITKHHDGFHMWDTAFSDYKITNSPFGRDYIGELVEACHKKDLKIGLYFSQRDWIHPDYEPVDPTKAHPIDKPPYFNMNDGEEFAITDKHRSYIKYMHNAVKELMTKYGKIDILWWDACYCDGMYDEPMWDSDELEREVRKLQPHILINNRAGLPGDFDTPECVVGMFKDTQPWETCMTLGKAWAWTGGEVKSFKTVICQLVGCLCGDGNYLPSIGAMPTGQFDKPETERIHQMGRFTKAYGDSIYGTRGGPWKSDKWGGSCYKKNIVYFHIVEAKEIDEITLLPIDIKILSYECLTGETVEIEQTSENTVVKIDKTGLDNADIIIKVIMEKDIVNVL